MLFDNFDFKLLNNADFKEDSVREDHMRKAGE